jgi:hypothetical protein
LSVGELLAAQRAYYAARAPTYEADQYNCPGGCSVDPAVDFRLRFRHRQARRAVHGDDGV